MKKKVVVLALLLLIFIMFILQSKSKISVTEEAEFSVRFHSFGKNTTINLKDFLGESKQYLVSKTENVIVQIDQKTGIAYLKAKPGWEGSEEIFFKTIESQPKIIIEEGEEEEEKPQPEEVPPPIVPENFTEEIRYEYEMPLNFFGETIDASVLTLLKDIKREEIKKLSSEMEENMLKIRINDEVDLNLEMNYIPAVSIDFSLGEKQEIEEEIETEVKKDLKSKISKGMIIAILSVIGMIGIYFYIRRYKKKEKNVKETVVGDSINKDIKQSSLYRLRKIQENIEKRSSEEFINILREFFSKYFGIEYNFEFKQLMKSAKYSNINSCEKNEINDFLNDVSKAVYYPSEDYAKTYGKGQISKKDLKKFIRKLKSIIRHL